MSRFVTVDQDAGRPTRRRSVYEDRPAPTRPWVQIADTNPLTGALEWEPDWAYRVGGWMPLDAFLRRR
jgi:hypothetical protein